MIILFDLDGTLIDSTEAILESFGVAFESHGKEVPSSEDIKAQIGYPLDVMFPTLGVPKKYVASYVDAYKMHYREISCLKTVLLPNAREAIDLARKYATLGVVTTKTAKYSKELLEYFGVMDSFDVLIGREDVTNPKPNPEPILKALQALEKDSNCWMIGDTSMDIEAASNAHISSVAVTCGYATKKSLKHVTSNIEKNSLEAVKFIIEQ